MYICTTEVFISIRKMNEQSAKKIHFNKSTLLSLKAELLKKQEEVYERKQLPQHRLENFKPSSTKANNDHKDNKQNKKTFKDSLKATDTEELEACRKSKLALQKKSELYEHLSDKAGNSQLAGRFLVDFDTKKKEEDTKPTLTPEQEEAQFPISNVGEDEWIEFTDCLGRTRKCHKSDLEMYVKRDKELMRVINKDNPNYTPDTDQAPEDPNKDPEKPFLVQKTNDYLQSLRKKWEEKEQEMLGKDRDIHYQDLLFDEARIHGVGYYAFSTDEAERKAQMEELKKRRDETLRKQAEAEEVRKQRDALMAARVAAARARQRARAGLPPEDPQQQQQKDFNTCLLEFLTQQRNEADAKAKEAEKKQKEEQEKEKQKLREAYVREWDIGKEGVDGNVKKFRELTQEEYVEQQRAKRIDEFAPLQTSVFFSKNEIASYDDRGKKIKSNSIPDQKKTWSDVRPVVAPPPPDIGDLSQVPEQKGLYFTTAKKDLKYKNFVQSTEPTPIVNEVSDNEEVTDDKIEKRKTNTNGSEIEPPATYEYYGPTPKKTKPQNPYEIDVREAYAQGAKSLESKSSNIKLPQHYDFTFD